MLPKFRLALVQLAVGANKTENLSRAEVFVRKAAKEGGAQVVALPECFNSPYGTQYFNEYAEDLSSGSSQSLDILKKMAKENSIHLIGGSIPEREGEKLFNTSVICGPDGNVIAKHRKVHLFDIDIPGKITFKESEILSPGNSFTSFATDDCKIGVGICYDIRFAEMALVYRDLDCKLLVYPGAFNMTTGPAHWEALARSRALDNQVYVATVSPARDTSASYVAWGHSTVMDPWGTVVAKTEEKEDIVYAEIDLEKLKTIRDQVPITKQRRNELYKVVTT